MITDSKFGIGLKYSWHRNPHPPSLDPYISKVGTKQALEKKNYQTQFFTVYPTIFLYLRLDSEIFPGVTGDTPTNPATFSDLDTTNGIAKVPLILGAIRIILFVVIVSMVADK